MEEVGARATGPAAEAMADAADPLAALRIGCLAWIRLAGDPVVRQITLDRRARRPGLAALAGPGRAGSARRHPGPAGRRRRTGRIPARHVDAFAHIVLAALNELALVIARADNPDQALPSGESAFDEFLDRLLGPVR